MLSTKSLKDVTVFRENTYKSQIYHISVIKYKNDNIRER